MTHEKEKETTMMTIVRAAIAKTLSDLADAIYKVAYKIEGPCPQCASNDWDNWDWTDQDGAAPDLAQKHPVGGVDAPNHNR